MSADTTPTSPLDDAVGETDATAVTPGPIADAAALPSPTQADVNGEVQTEYAPPPADDGTAHSAPVAATAAVSSTADSASASAASAEPTPPRTRGAAIVWGLLFAAIAAFGIWTLTDDDRRASTADWITTLTPNTVYSLVLLTIGVLILVSGAVGLIRHAQRRAAPQR
ncbi:hypothetical protein [Microbacterium croceum]|uniref:hypothetical protein n=1 Tax=Microbacterium croceum TaxID=2851645 RepID=UPI001FFC5FA9|nr:hypothetical protein [Microbacterium croceum]